MTYIAIFSVLLNILLFVLYFRQEKKSSIKALPNNISTLDELKKAAKEEALKEIEGAKKDLEKSERQVNMDKLEQKVTSTNLEEKQHDLVSLVSKNEQLQVELRAKQDRLDENVAKLVTEYREKLKELSGLDEHQVKAAYVDELHRKVGQELLEWQHLKLKQARQNVDKIASEIVSQAVQRCSSEVANEHTLTVIDLEDDDLKGKLIGKNGRNIQWLEKTLGVEVIIDERPHQIAISGFNSVRRHIAQKTIEMLIDDGRIHPASIEEMYAKAKQSIQEQIMEAGNNAVRELGIQDFPEPLVELIGRLKFRTSYGQNMLRHSLEMAHLARLMAVEMNEAFPNLVVPIDVQICVKGALLHDIGKAMDEETIPKGNHVDLGEKICERFGLDWRIKKCISSHHNEQYRDNGHGFCIEAPIVDACDNISGSRAGARKETTEEYKQRLEKLEDIANSIEGVTKSWIMRGNKELWVFFDTNAVDANQMQTLIHQITERIETEITTPTEIKVVGYWEGKVVEYAK